eukprot:2633424-Rhodomonas_salina.1
MEHVPMAYVRYCATSLRRPWYCASVCAVLTELYGATRPGYAPGFWRGAPTLDRPPFFRFLFGRLVCR